MESEEGQDRQANQNILEWDDGEGIISDLTLSIENHQLTQGRELEDIRYYLTQGKILDVELTANHWEVGKMELSEWDGMIEIRWITVYEEYRDRGYLKRTLEALATLGMGLRGEAADEGAKVIWERIEGIEFISEWEFVIPHKGL